MSRKANPTLVGAFVLGAIALAVAAVSIFGSGTLFRKNQRGVAYFEGNVRGLNVGAPVNLRGVPVGQVTAIQLTLDTQTMQTYIPVYIELDPNSIRRVGTGPTGETLLAEAIRKGLRAQLAAQSFVTGQLLVELDLHPGTPVNLIGEDKSVPEIPTIKSDIEHLKDVLGQLPLQELVGAAMKAVISLDKILSSPEIPAILASVAGATEDARKVTAQLAEDYEPLSGQLTEILTNTAETTADLEIALGEFRQVLKTTNEAIAPSLRATLRAAEGAMQQAEKTLSNTNGMLAGNSPQRQDINDTLRNLAAASRSMRSLADQLDRKPNAIVVGR
jgi:paraquat-inducible protein B